MRYHVLGSYLFFMNNRFVLTFERESERWISGMDGFQCYPIASVSMIDQIFVWNDSII